LLDHLQAPFPDNCWTFFSTHMPIWWSPVDQGLKVIYANDSKLYPEL
jgi:hypothetical protein